MNFRERFVRLFTPRDTPLVKALKAETAAQRERLAEAETERARLQELNPEPLDWRIADGETIIADWDHPRAGQGFFTIRPSDSGYYYELHRDSLTRARSYYLGGYGQIEDAKLAVYRTITNLEEQYSNQEQ